MIATTAPQDLASRSWNGLLKVAAVVTLLVVLLAGSFAVGRGTADDTITVVREAQESTPIPSMDDAPVAPSASPIDPSACIRQGHQPPPC